MQYFTHLLHTSQASWADLNLLVVGFLSSVDSSGRPFNFSPHGSSYRRSVYVC